MSRIISVLLVILAVAWLFRQVRKPSGWLGRRMARAMNLSHGAMTEWALQHLIAEICPVRLGGTSFPRTRTIMSQE